MSNDPSLRSLIEMSDRLLNGRDYFVGTLVDRFRQASNQHPADQAIALMRRTFEKTAGKDGNVAMVSQRQIQDIYDQVSSLGNRVAFKEELGDLLIEDRVQNIAHRNEAYIGGLRDSGTSFDIIDGSKAAEFSGIWGDPKEATLKSSFAENGRKGIEIELLSLGFSNPAVAIADSDGSFVIYAAEITTKKGLVPFLIPAEVKLGSVLMPSVFVSGDEFLDLTGENINNHIVRAMAGSPNKATPKAVLATLNKLIGNEPAPYVAAELSDNIHIEAPQFLMDFIGHTDPTVAGRRYIDDQAPPAVMPKALMGISESAIKETLVEAGLSYPRDTVLLAKATVCNELRLCKIAYDRVVIDSEFDGGITLATNIVGKGGKKRIEIPVEISKNNKVLMPCAFTSGAFASSFDEEGLRAFASSVDGAEFDPILSDKHDMTFSSLHKLALRKAAYGDFISATETLSVIAEKFGDEFHKVAHDDLIDLIRVGYTVEEKPLTAMEKFMKEAEEKANDKEYNIKMSGNSVIFYPKE